MTCTLRPEWSTVDLQWPSATGPVSVKQLLTYTRDSTHEQEMIARMWVMCAIEMQSALSTTRPCKPHFDRYRSWLQSEYEKFKQPNYPQVPNAKELVEMGSEERLKAMNHLREKFKGTHMWPVIEGPWRVYENVVDIVEGRAKLVKILLQDGLLVKFYDWANGISKIEPFFTLLGLTNPKLRILEIGAGTGGTTARVLEGLTGEKGEKLYSKYVYTDIATQFFEAAKKRFEAYANIEYRKLDITKDPREQGFAPGEYDLVIASNVLHATPCLVNTLKNCRILLHPKGFLFNQELSPPGKYVDFMVGMLPGWWLGDADGRPNGPTIPPAEWHLRLEEAGFEGLHAVGLDSEPPFYYNANMVARPAADAL